MAQFQNPVFILNPRSSGGLSKKRLMEIELAIKGKFPSARLKHTDGPRAATRLTAEARAAGADLVGIVGGDGSINEAVNGLLQAPLPRDGGPAMPALGLVPTGTGCDLVKSVGVPRDLHRALDIIAAGDTHVCDAGRIVCLQRDDGSPMVYYFINFASLGASGEVVSRVNRSSKRLGGLVSFAAATVATVLTYPGSRVKVRINGGEPRVIDTNVLMLANGQYQGGGMRTGGEAKMDDGVFRMVLVEQRNPLQTVANIGALYSGETQKISFAETLEAVTHVEAEPEKRGEVVLVECDGEQPGILPATYDLIPRAIPICVGPDAVAITR